MYAMNTVSGIPEVTITMRVTTSRYQAHVMDVVCGNYVQEERTTICSFMSLHPGNSSKLGYCQMADCAEIQVTEINIIY